MIMKNRPLSILIANLLAAPALALAADGGMEYTGSVSIGARSVNDKTQDPSKLNEYRDLDGGAVLGGFELRGRGNNYFLNGFGENLGLDDQYLDLKGGKYGAFRYQLYLNDLRHNFGSGPGARSPFAGVGGATLTAPSIAGGFNTNPATWNTFDDSYKRRDWGGMFEYQSGSPWYIRAEANEVKRSGINVIAAANGMSPGNGFTDLPAPIDFSTKNYTAEVGYSTKTAHVAANLLYSKFDNGNELLSWSNRFSNPAGGLLDTTVLPSDNNLTKIGINGNIRQLPGDSTLAGRITYSNLTNSVDMLQSMLVQFTTPGLSNQIAATNPSSPTFKGKLQTTTLAVSLSSHPMKNLDTRVYWNYNNESNKSTRMSFNPAANQGLRGGAASGAGNNPPVNCDSGGLNPCTPEFFHYKKNNLGVEASYKVNAGNKIFGGWDYYDVERERIDFHGNKDNKLFVEWKNNSFDMVTGRIKYHYLQRRSDWSLTPGLVQANPIEPYVRRFDLANLNQNQVKFVLDASPAPFVEIGFEGIFKKNDYSDTTLGRTQDSRQEYYASLSAGDPSVLRGLIFGDIEITTYDSYHRVGTGNPNPATAPTATTYNWDARNRDKSWQLGIGADWSPMARLKLTGSYILAQTRGTTDFSVQQGGPTGTPFPSITNFDNTKRKTLNLKAVYEASKQWEITGGYAYEQYKYSDIGYDNTRYFIPSNAAGATASNPAYVANQQSSVVTGRYSFQPYTANIVYLIGKYKF
jgi:MtrB/PioB family decaheme-associated outer membrane protein